MIKTKFLISDLMTDHFVLVCSINLHFCRNQQCVTQALNRMRDEAQVTRNDPFESCINVAICAVYSQLV